MIAQFKIKNYRSILDMTLDFRFTEGKAPNGFKDCDTHPFLEDGAANRLVPCLAIFGANASGKTNILGAMATLCKAVLAKEAPTTAFFNPNKLHDGRDSTVFELTAILGGDTYTYQLDYNNTEIRQEVLTKNGEQLYGVNQQKGTFAIEIRAEGYENERLQKILDVECSDGKGHQTVCFLKRIAQNYSGLNADLKNVFDYVSNNIIVLGDDELPLPVALDMLSHFYDGNQKAALAEVVEIIRKLDVDVLSISVNPRLIEKADVQSSVAKGCIVQVDEVEKKYQIVDVHSVHNNMHGRPVTFDFYREESRGTQRVAGLVGLILACLKGGRALFIDELENSLHPVLVKEVVRLFKDKKYNTKNAQVTFTTHNTDILDDSVLRLGEVAIVRKSEPAGTLVKRLVDFRKDGRDVRNVTNFRKQYLAGFYSGIPHPAI